MWPGDKIRVICSDIQTNKSVNRTWADKRLLISLHSGALYSQWMDVVKQKHPTKCHVMDWMDFNFRKPYLNLTHFPQFSASELRMPGIANQMKWPSSSIVVILDQGKVRGYIAPSIFKEITFAYTSYFEMQIKMISIDKNHGWENYFYYYYYILFNWNDCLLFISLSISYHWHRAQCRAYTHAVT